MNLHDYDWSRLQALGYPSDFAEKMKDDPCWKGYEMVGHKKKGGKTVPNCVPKAKKQTSDHAEGDKRKPLIAGPSAGSPSFAEGEGETFDFARCQRPDGSYYGTGGTCRKGSQVSDADVLKLKASLEKQVGEAAKSGDMEKTNNLMKALSDVTERARERGLVESSQKTAANALNRDPSKDIKRGNTLIGTSGLNKIADNIKEFETRLKGARSEGERELLNKSIKQAKGLWLTEKAKEFQKMAAKANDDGFRDRAIQYSKEAGKLLQEKADLDRD